jgi:signal transduction histidine kinase
VVCAVQDQGQGLSREDQSKLFQRGVKLSSVPTGGEPSSGYGLAVAKELTTLMQGEIWCDSELGKGARFLLRLPEYRDTNETSSSPLEMPAR